MNEIVELKNLFCAQTEYMINKRPIGHIAHMSNISYKKNNNTWMVEIGPVILEKIIF